MNSTQKLYSFLEHVQGLEDEQLLEQLPIISSPLLARSVLAAASRQVPTDYRELDRMIEQGIGFLEELRSDQP